MNGMNDTGGRRRPGIKSEQAHPPPPWARRHRLRCDARGDGGHHPRRCADPGCWCRLRGPRWWRADPGVRIAVVTGFFAVVGIVIAAALLRWSARPAKRFVWTAVTLTAISLVPPLLSRANTATITALIGRATPRLRQ